MINFFKNKEFISIFYLGSVLHIILLLFCHYEATKLRIVTVYNIFLFEYNHILVEIAGIHSHLFYHPYATMI